MITAAINAKPGEHVVHFYRGDGDLAETVAAYLAGAVGERGIAIAITTAAHLPPISRALAGVGVDVEAATADRRLVLLDAGEMLAKLTVEGRIDRKAFAREVGTPIRDARGRAREVRAYGEMVDLLWQAGDIPGAIELEKLWNELIGEHRFTLLCAYQSTAVSGPEHVQALHEVCHLHSSVSSIPDASPAALGGVAPERELSREFQPGDYAPRAARRFVQEALERWGYDRSTVEDARLLISELATNAVIHTRSPFRVSISSQPPKLRLAVADESPALPRSDAQRMEFAHRGRGLRIVAALAQRWGVATASPGKTVWAELHAELPTEGLHAHVA